MESKPLVLGSTQLLVPPYIESDPVLWFSLLESEFNSKSILLDSVKFSHLTMRLPPNVLLQVRDVILSTTEGNKYTELKALIINRTTPSERIRMQKLFGGLQLDNRKPSALLAELRVCLGGLSMDELLLRELWLQRLPDQVQGILTLAKSSSLNETAQMADEIIERVIPCHQIVAPVSKFQPSSSSADQTDVRSEIAALRRDLERATVERRGCTKNCLRRRSPSLTSSAICRIHRKYGDKARNCHKPCSFHKLQSGNFKADA